MDKTEMIKKIREALSYKSNIEINEKQIKLKHLDSMDLQYEVMRILDEYNNSSKLEDKIFFNIRFENDKIVLNFI
jgi:uncharacterized membrane protein